MSRQSAKISDPVKFIWRCPRCGYWNYAPAEQLPNNVVVCDGNPDTEDWQGPWSDVKETA